MKVKVKGRTLEIPDAFRSCPSCGCELLTPCKVDRFGRVLFRCELCGAVHPEEECRKGYPSIPLNVLVEGAS